MKDKKVALITGVLGGIGSALAEEFQKDGFYVFGLDVRYSDHSNCDEFLQFDLNQFVADAKYRSEWSAIFSEKVEQR